MNDAATYSIGPNTGSAGVDQCQARPWFVVSGPAQRQSGEMAARIKDLERKIAALEADKAVAG